MRCTLLAVTLAVLTMAACSKPNQALPEQEKKNYEKITSRPAAPAAAEPSAPSSASSDASADASPSPAADTSKTK